MDFIHHRERFIMWDNLTNLHPSVVTIQPLLPLQLTFSRVRQLPRDYRLLPPLELRPAPCTKGEDSGLMPLPGVLSPLFVALAVPAPEAI